MKMLRIFIVALSVLSILVQTSVVRADQIPINLLPMYGAPSVVKTADQKKADEEFISNATKNAVSRDSAAVVFWSMGMQALKDRDKETAMKRFNQSWLLDPECFLAYWGFGKIIYNNANSQEALQEALGYFDTSLTLLQSKKERPIFKNLKQGLYYDIGRSYFFAAILDTLKIPLYCKKADGSFEQLSHENPKFAEGYHLWLMNAMISKDDRKAWKIIHAARRAGVNDFSEETIKKLLQRMPEPKE